MKKSILIYVVKNAVGAAIAILIAQLLNLTNVMTAGVIVLLSIQNTRKESVSIALKRLAATFIALIIAPIIFKLFSFNPFSFGIFLLVFIPILIRLNMQDGIVVNSVLVTHLIIDQDISIQFLINELAIMVIGLSVALLLNIYMPNVEEQLEQAEKDIEKWIREVLVTYAQFIKNTNRQYIDEETLFARGDALIQKAVDHAHIYTNNQLLMRENYHMAYVYMRKQQIDMLKHIYSYITRLTMIHPVSEKVINYTVKTSDAIGIKNRAKGLLVELNELRQSFKTWELPRSREEFENRALLYQYLNDLESFLSIKDQFHEKHQYSPLHLKRLSDIK